MATNKARSPIPANHAPRIAGHTLKNIAKHKFRVQSAPPLSLQQFLRSATGVIAGHKDWQHSGKYREPVYRAYLSPEVRKIEKRVEPVWYPPGKYKEKPPTSLSPEKIIPKRTPEPVWRPSGKVGHEQMPYFDPPSLRWSLQDLLRSMPEMRPKTFHTSRSMSTIRRKKEVEET